MRRLELITTDRLILRRWRDEDREPFAAINADPEVMRHYPSVLTREQSDAIINRIEQHFDQHGFGLYAVERREDGRCIGFVGLQWVPFDASFTPAVEIGWRLATDTWGTGYATEAAQAVLDAASEQLELPEIVAMAVLANWPSIAVMRRIGMQHDHDFDNPRVEEPHLRRHVLYRIARTPAPAPEPTRGQHVHDVRHAVSVELRPDAALDARLRELAASLESAGLLAPGAATALRFQPHLTLLRARSVPDAALAAAGAAAGEQDLTVRFTDAGTFGDGRIIWLALEDAGALHDLRRALLAHLPHADVDPLVTSRGWTPHLTVAYAVDEPEHRAAALELVRAALPLTGTWRTLETWQLDERPTRQLTQRDLSR